MGCIGKKGNDPQVNYKMRKSKEEILRELVEREWNEPLVVSIELGLAETVQEIFPEVRVPKLTVGDEPWTRKSLIEWHGKFYDLDPYVRLLLRLDEEAIEHGEYKRWTKEGVEGIGRINTRVARMFVEDMKAGRAREWEGAHLIKELWPKYIA